MKKVILSLVLLCGLALIGTSCKKEQVKPETEKGTMTVGSQSHDINTADAVSYGQQNAIVLASKAMTVSDNEGIAIVFDGNIKPGTYTLDDNSKDNKPKVVGLRDFNMGEIQFVMNADTIFFGDVYFWVSGELSVTESNGTYTIVLSHCVATNANGTSINLALNYSGTLTPFTIDADNKFKIGDTESPIGLAGITSLGGMDTIGNYHGVRSMLFMSADRKRFFIVSYLGNESVDGEHSLGYLITPYLPKFPCLHVALDGDFWNFQPQTGYIAQSGTLKVVSNDDGTKTVTMENVVLKNVEHPNSIFFPDLSASLQYHGPMYEIGQ